MKRDNNYRPGTRSRYAYHGIIDRIGDLSYEHARMIQERLAHHVNTVKLNEEAQPPPSTEPAKEPKITYQQEYTRCGKATCQRCGAGQQGHGPYWYGYWSESGKTKKRYIGKELPAQVDENDRAIVTMPDGEILENAIPG